MRNMLFVGWLSIAAIIATAGAQQTNITPQARSKFTADNKITEIELEAHFVTTIRVPEPVANLCFGGPKRNRMFMCATTSLYSVYLNTRGC